MLIALLWSMGALVRAASSARGALSILAEFTPSVILTDLGMPGEDGIWLLHRLRADARWRSIPVVAFTGRYDSAATKRAGFDALLRKPDDLERIFPTIVRLIESRQVA